MKAFSLDAINEAIPTKVGYVVSFHFGLYFLLAFSSPFFSPPSLSLFLHTFCLVSAVSGYA